MKFRLLWSTGVNIIIHMDTIIIKWCSTLTETVHISAKLNKFEKTVSSLHYFWSKSTIELITGSFPIFEEFNRN